MLNYTQFLNALKNRLGRMLGEGVEIRTLKVRKNNVGWTDTLTIQKKGEAGGISPSFSVRSLFLMYTEEEMTLEEILKETEERYYHAVRQIRQDRDSFCFPGSYEEIREKIFFRAVSRERNRELLDEVPHVDILDFSVVFAILALEKGEEIGTILIRNEMMEEWGVSPEEIRKQAGRNTERLFPAEVGSICETMRRMVGQAEMEEVETYPEDVTDNMYIATNRKKNYGFSVILYDTVLRELSRKFGKNLYILPSSIDEAILIPDDGQKMGGKLREMVREVNRTQVPPEKVMSDEVYYYDREKDLMEMAE